MAFAKGGRSLTALTAVALMAGLNGRNSFFLAILVRVLELSAA
jgi:hypothetical protein